MKALVLLFVGGLFFVGDARAETYEGTCTISKNGQSSSPRSCKIGLATGRSSACPGDYVITLHGITIADGETPTVMVRVEDGSFSGSCQNDRRSVSGSGSVGGGSVSGSLSVTYTKGSYIGQSWDIAFSGSSR